MIDIDRLSAEVSALVKGKLNDDLSSERSGDRRGPFVGARLLVALSGGADSVAMLRALKMLGCDVEAAHCNFHLRGSESDRDETFCKNLCESLGVELHLAHFDTVAFAQLHGVSIEMAARTLRYDYFFKLLQDLSLEAVCVAHHRDDSVETVLLNMVRGTGMEGLKGIQPRNGKVLRPMLDLSRREIECYLSRINQDYITDSTNLVDDVQRNKIRLNVIPELQSVNPSAVENIHRLTRRVEDVLRIVDASVSDMKQRIVSEHEGEMNISIGGLLAEPGAETKLWYLLRDKNFSSAQVDDVFAALCVRKTTGKMWHTKTHTALIDRDSLMVTPRNEESSFSMRIPETGTYLLSGNRKLRIDIAGRGEDFSVSREADCVNLDAEKVKFPLTVRTIERGDWFVPFGMKGRKLISDFLTDLKMSLLEKQRQLVVTDSAGNIVWVVGLRPDNRFRVNECTVEILTIKSIVQ